MHPTTDPETDESLFPAPEAGETSVSSADTGDSAMALPTAASAPAEDASAAASTEPATAGAIDPAELKAILETLLFVSHEPVTLERLVATLGAVSKADVRLAIEALQADYETGRGLQLVQVAGGYQLTTRPEHAPWIKAFGKSKTAPKLSRSALESLAIIAYKQPIVRGDVEAIRGVETSGVIRTLLERKFVRIVGRKDVPGRPIMYGTTKHFLQHFGLRDLSELPPLREFKELGESEQASLPEGDEPIQVTTGTPDVAVSDDPVNPAHVTAATSESDAVRDSTSDPS